MQEERVRREKEWTKREPEDGGGRHGGAGVPRVMVIASEYTKAPLRRSCSHVSTEKKLPRRGGTAGKPAQRWERKGWRASERQVEGDTKKTGTYLEANVTLL